MRVPGGAYITPIQPEPSLLDLLKRAVGMLTGEVEPPITDEELDAALSEWADEARAVIAKAEGRA